MVGIIRISYWLGVLAAVCAVLYRGLWTLGLASSWPEMSRILPRNLLHLSALLFLVCLATDVYARHRTTP